ncbi:hypothetical protein LZ023_26450 [Pseudomonas silvicola]|nr:hypothetical protein LZ023_26450 [Pseudomonas silvicola]
MGFLIENPLRFKQRALILTNSRCERLFFVGRKVQASHPRGVRHNNPCNINISNTSNWLGQVCLVQTSEELTRLQAER